LLADASRRIQERDLWRSARKPEESMSKNRVEAFSDGVFAIVITLLILNVHLDRQHALTLEALRNLVPDVFAFVLSFVIVGIYWVSHHNMLQLIKRVDRQFLWIYLALLLVVVFIPFPASLLGQHLGDPIAVILYGVNLMAVNAISTALWLYAGSHPGLMTDHVPPETVRFVARLHAVPILVYAIGAILAPWYITASILLFVAVPAFFILPNPFLERRLLVLMRHHEPSERGHS
jgi:uncharacterized membrane protein